MARHSFGLFLAAMANFTGLADGAELPKPPRDWKLELVAQAPVISHPSVVCTSPDGRVFVAEDPMDITVAANTNQGKIVCFHPDGRHTVFAKRLYAIFGMQYLEGKLYVLHNPKFSVFTDKEGVGSERRDLIQSTQPNPWALDWNDHVPANFRLAMDSYFYVAIGDKGLYGATGPDGRRVDMHGGGILRLRSDGSEMEVYANGVRNILDVAINSEDALFTYDNTDEHNWMGRLTHMVEGGFYGYPYDFAPRQPYTLWMMYDFGGGAATGALAYNEDALPEEYNGNLFLADFGKRQLLRVRLARDGATYRVAAHEEMFANPPEDFRPVGIALGSDGRSFYICDWNHRDTKEEGANVGRLWKLSFTGPIRATPKPAWYLPAAMGKRFNAETSELRAGLAHPSREVRLTAQRRLSDRKESKVFASILSDRSAPPVARWHAIWGFDAIDGGKDGREAILRAINDQDSILRQQAVRQLGNRRVAGAVPTLIPRLADSDATVRFEAATALGRIADPRAVSALSAALTEKDMFARFAMFTALNRIGREQPKTWRTIAQGLQSKHPAIRQATEFALRETYDETLLGVFADFSRSASPALRETALKLVAGLHHQYPKWKGEWWAYHPALAAPPAKQTDWAGTREVMALLRQNVSASDPHLRLIAVDGFQAARDTNAAALLRGQFSQESDSEVRRRIIEVLGEFKDREFSGSLAQMLRSKPVDESTMIAGIRAAARIGTSELVSAILDLLGAKSPVLEREAIRVLGQSKVPQALSALRSLATNGPPEVRREAVSALGELRDKRAVPDLLVAWKSAETQANALSALVLLSDIRALDAYVDGLSSPNATMREQCSKALKPLRDEALPLLEQRAGQLKPQALAELKRLYSDHPLGKKSPLFAAASREPDVDAFERYALEHAGSAERGQRLFFDQNGLGCIRCHSLGGEGTNIGPDLTLIGAQFPRATLIEHVLYPSRVVREGYQQIIIETRDGETSSGLLKAENAETITLMTAEARLQSIPKNSIINRTMSKLSLMPEGLQVGLTLEQFADLISFLESRKADPRKASLP